MPFYLAIEIGVIAVPLLFSFDKRLRFYRKWKSVLAAMILVGIPFIAVDAYFTARGVWGFGAEYHSNIILLNLPLEEWLFFLVAPYACLFIHAVVLHYFPSAGLNIAATRIVSVLLMLPAFTLLIRYPGKVYTVCTGVGLIIALSIGLYEKTQVLKRFYLTFPVMLIPFFLVNAMLTGSFFQNEVVWYNDAEIIGIRILTMPVEDISYAFVLVFLNLVVAGKLERRFRFPQEPAAHGSS